MLPMTDDVPHASQADKISASPQPLRTLPLHTKRPAVYKAEMTRRCSSDVSHVVPPSSATTCMSIAEMPHTYSSHAHCSNSDDDEIQRTTAAVQAAQDDALLLSYGEPMMHVLRRSSSGISSIAQLGEDESVASEHDDQAGGHDDRNDTDAIRRSLQADTTHCTTASTSSNATVIANATTTTPPPTATTRAHDVSRGEVALGAACTTCGPFAGTPPHTPIDNVIPALHDSYSVHGNVSTTTAPARTVCAAHECDKSGTSHRTRPAYALSFQRSLLTPHKSTLAPARHHARRRALDFATRVRQLSVQATTRRRTTCRTATTTAAATLPGPKDDGLPGAHVATPRSSGLGVGVHDERAGVAVRRGRGPSATRPESDSPAIGACDAVISRNPRSPRAVRPDLVDYLEPSRNPYSPYRYPVALQTMTLFTPLVLARSIVQRDLPAEPAMKSSSPSPLQGMPLRAEAAVVMYEQTIPCAARRHADPSQSVDRVTEPSHVGCASNMHHTRLAHNVAKRGSGPAGLPVAASHLIRDEDNVTAAAPLRLDSSDEQPPLETLDGLPLAGLSSLSDILRTQDTSLRWGDDSSVHDVQGSVKETVCAAVTSPCPMPHNDWQPTTPHCSGQAAATALTCTSHKLPPRHTVSPASPAVRGCRGDLLAESGSSDDETVMGQGNIDSPRVRRATVQWCAKNETDKDFLIAVAEPSPTCVPQTLTAAHDGPHAASCRVVRRLGYSESDAGSERDGVAESAVPATMSTEPHGTRLKARRALSAPLAAPVSAALRALALVPQSGTEVVSGPSLLTLRDRVAPTTDPAATATSASLHDLRHDRNGAARETCIAMACAAPHRINSPDARMTDSSMTVYDVADTTSEYNGTESDDNSSCNDSEDEPGDRFRQHHRFQFLHHVPLLDSLPFFLPIATDANGIVWLATHRLDGMPYAVKEVLLVHTSADKVAPTTGHTQRHRQEQLCAELECTALNHAAPTTTLRQNATRFLVSYAIPVRYPTACPSHALRESGGLTVAHKHCSDSNDDESANTVTEGAMTASGQQVLLLQSEYFPRGSVWEWALDPFAKRGTSAATCSTDPTGLHTTTTTTTTTGVAAIVASQVTPVRPAYDVPPEAFWCDVLHQALCALQTLHAHELIHGCPVPLHLWVGAAGVFKLGDFGAARKRPQRYPDTAPHFLRNSLRRYTPRGDERNDAEPTPYAMDVCVLCNGLLLLLMLCCLKASGATSLPQRKTCSSTVSRADVPSRAAQPTTSSQSAQAQPAVPLLPCGCDASDTWQAHWYSAELMDAFLCHSLADDKPHSVDVTAPYMCASHSDADSGAGGSDECTMSAHAGPSQEQQRLTLLRAASACAHGLRGFLRLLQTLRMQPHTATTALQAFAARHATVSPALLAARALYDAELTRLLCHRATLLAQLQLVRTDQCPQSITANTHAAPAEVKAAVSALQPGETVLAGSRSMSEPPSAECHSSSGVASEEVTGGQTDAGSSLLVQLASQPQHVPSHLEKSAQSCAGSTSQPRSTVPRGSSSEAHTTSTTSPPLLPPPFLITPCRSVPPSPCVTAMLRPDMHQRGTCNGRSGSSSKVPSPALLPHTWSITSESHPHTLSRRAPLALPPALALAPPLSFAGAGRGHGWPATHPRSVSDVQPLRSTNVWGTASAAGTTRRASMSRVSWPAAMSALPRARHATAGVSPERSNGCGGARLLHVMDDAPAVHEEMRGVHDVTGEAERSNATVAAAASVPLAAQRMTSNGSYASRLEGVIRPQVQTTVESMLLAAIGLPSETSSSPVQPQAVHLFARQLTWHYRQCVQLMHCDEASVGRGTNTVAADRMDAASAGEAGWCHVRDCCTLRRLRPLTSWE